MYCYSYNFYVSKIGEILFGNRLNLLKLEVVKSGENLNELENNNIHGVMLNSRLLNKVEGDLFTPQKVELYQSYQQILLVLAIHLLKECKMQMLNTHIQ